MAEENTQNISKVVFKNEKNLKRVEQGNKLAEWNRKNKKTTLEVPLVQEVQEEHAPEEPTQKVQAQNVLAQDVLVQKMLAQKYWILGGTLAIIGVLYLNPESVPQQVQGPLLKQIQKVPDPPTDPFSMD